MSWGTSNTRQSRGRTQERRERAGAEGTSRRAPWCPTGRGRRAWRAPTELKVGGVYHSYRRRESTAIVSFSLARFWTVSLL